MLAAIDTVHVWGMSLSTHVSQKGSQTEIHPNTGMGVVEKELYYTKNGNSRKICSGCV